MVDMMFGLKEKDWAENILAAKDFAVKRKVDFEGDKFAWEFTKMPLRIEDCFLITDIPEHGWLTISFDEFTSEMIIALLQDNPKLATKEVLIEIMAAFDNQKEEDKK